MVTGKGIIQFRPFGSNGRAFIVVFGFFFSLHLVRFVAISITATARDESITRLVGGCNRKSLVGRFRHAEAFGWHFMHGSIELVDLQCRIVAFHQVPRWHVGQYERRGLRHGFHAQGPSIVTVLLGIFLDASWHTGQRRHRYNTWHWHTWSREPSRYKNCSPHNLRQ